MDRKGSQFKRCTATDSQGQPNDYGNNDDRQQNADFNSTKQQGLTGPTAGHYRRTRRAVYGSRHQPD